MATIAALPVVGPSYSSALRSRTSADCVHLSQKSTLLNPRRSFRATYSPAPFSGAEMRSRLPLSGRGEALSCLSSSYSGVNICLSLHSKAPRKTGARGPVRVEARGRGDSAGAADRVLASLAYLLPLLDGCRYGRYLFLQYPSSRILLEPIGPLIKFYNSFPYASILAFFILYIGVIQNQSFSRYVRYNCMQAVILDILMILPSLFERLISPSSGLGLDVIILLYNTVFIYLFSCFVFGVGSCLLGKSPRLPLVADAAEAQVPF